jgi:cytochrome c-type biogenesis protein CcmE
MNRLIALFKPSTQFFACFLVGNFYLFSCPHPYLCTMKKLNIAILVIIAAAIVFLISFSGGEAFSTYESVASAKAKEGQFVHVIAKLDSEFPVQYDPTKDANYLAFNVKDSLGNSMPVVYHNPEPKDFRSSERLVLKGQMQKGVFECKEILLKCPSKYKDDVKTAEQALQTQTN